MIHIEPHPDFTETEVLVRTARQALDHGTAGAGRFEDGAADATELTIVLTDDDQLRQLNRDYLGIDDVTDVLSFPASESDPDTGTVYLGDILISLPRARQQALDAGHTLGQELQLLVVHGVLHLLGYDHADAPEKSRMWQAQAEILSQLGLAAIKIQES